MPKKCTKQSLGDTRFPDVWLELESTRYYVEVKTKQFKSSTTGAKDVGEFIDFNVDVTGSRDVPKNAYHFLLLIKYYPADTVYNSKHYKHNTPFLWMLHPLNQFTGTLTLCDSRIPLEVKKKNVPFGTFLEEIQPVSASTQKRESLMRMGKSNVEPFKKKHAKFVEKFKKGMNRVFAVANHTRDTSNARIFGQLMEKWVREAMNTEKLLKVCMKINYHITATKFDELASNAPEVLSGPFDDDLKEIEAIDKEMEEKKTEKERGTGEKGT